jgi:hypothetical protein
LLLNSQLSIFKELFVAGRALPRRPYVAAEFRQSGGKLQKGSLTWNPKKVAVARLINVICCGPGKVYNFGKNVADFGENMGDF